MVLFVPKTKPKIIGDKVEFESEAKETLTKEEFVNVFESQRSESHRLESALIDLRKQLSEVEKVEQDEELSKFMEMLDKAAKVKKKAKIVKEIQDIESRLVTIKAILKDFKQAYDTIKNERCFDSNTDR